MFETLPSDTRDALDWGADKYQPYLDALADATVSADTLHEWMSNWSTLSKFMSEVYMRLYVATNQDTTDEAAENRLRAFLTDVYPLMSVYEDKLNRKLLESGVEPENFDVQLRNMRANVALFREENLPIQTEIQKLGMKYDKIIAAQTVEWEGEEKTLTALLPLLQDQDRSKREAVYRLMAERKLQDRDALNDLWVQFLDLRQQLAENADLPDYRTYRWQQLNRFDYTPDDAQTFHQAIEAVVVPMATRLYEKKREQLGVDSLRPWDVGDNPSQGSGLDPLGREPLKPYDSIDEMEETLQRIFTKVDPALGDYFGIMRTESLLDLDNRKGKAPGGYCTDFAVQERPFIFMNAVGLHDDVQTLLHEGGHAFHVFESVHLPYHQQLDPPMEFAEVASMAMELIASPYLTSDQGGFYTAEESARARTQHIEQVLTFWAYMAVVDAFQHWVYSNIEDAKNPDNCDAKWSELWDRFLPAVDFSGLDAIKATGWHRKLHIFQVPFYYIEYGLAQLGAIQVWANALDNQTQAVADYRKALALGGTATLPELFKTAGAQFGFDRELLGKAVDLLAKTLDSLEAETA